MFVYFKVIGFAEYNRSCVFSSVLPLSVRVFVGTSTLPSIRVFLSEHALGVDSVMDEFDVFMDAMSRNIAMKQVVNFAKNCSQRQFILITPQVRSSQPNVFLLSSARQRLFRLNFGCALAVR